MAYNSVFERVEKKYRVGATQRGAVEAACRDAAMAVDAYGRTRITSLYLDTPDRTMIARSMEKPLYKEKLRLRAYGEAAGVALMAAFGAGPVRREAGASGLVRRAAGGAGPVRRAVLGAGPVRREAGGAPLSDAEVEARVAAALAAAGLNTAPTVFFGIKKKFKGIVYKRRLALTLPAALAFVSGLSYEQARARWPVADAVAAEDPAPAVRQIARELTAAMDRWLPLAPSMGIACDREAWGRAAVAAPEGVGEAGETGGTEAAGPFGPCLHSASGAARHPAFDLALHSASGAARHPAFDPGLRLTFDNGLVYLDCHQSAAPWMPIIASDEAILEIKSAGPYPPWLVTALSAHRVYPASFTKYGSAHQLCDGATPFWARGAG